MEKRILINNNETSFWIDTNGRLRNEKTKRWLKGAINKGYHFYNVYFRGKQYTLYTHRLVAQYFIPNENNYSMVHHKDGNRLNNNVYNLEWISNEQHNEIHRDLKSHPHSYVRIDTQEIDLSKLRQFRNTPYYVAESGRIFNLDKNIELSLEKTGSYYRVSLQYGLNKKFLVHRVVWEAFNGEIPKGLEINHIDTNPSNNSLENLELISHSDNCKKANHKNIKVYSVNIETKEIVHYSSVSDASRKVLGYRDGRKIPWVIENKEILNNCYWYYEEERSSTIDVAKAKKEAPSEEG